jgi:prepilin-type N-terminal cleavage/methylation domain-containing protein
MKQNLNKKGFTLIELLVVIAIIGILAAITVVSVQGPRNKANDTKNLANIRQIASIMEQYAGDNGSYNTTTVAVTTPAGLTTHLVAYGTPLPTVGSLSISVPANGPSYCFSVASAAGTSGGYIKCTSGAQCSMGAAVTACP